MKKNKGWRWAFVPSALMLLLLGSLLIRGSEAKILFVGDMSFDRHIRRVVNEKGGDFVFSCVADFLKDADLVVGNLEGPITNKPSVSIGSVVGSPNNFTFTFPPHTADLLYKHNIKLVNIGNNHIDDFGKEGLSSTQKYLEEGGVEYFGGVFGKEPIYRTRLGGRGIAFISYNQFGGESPEIIAKKIKEESEEGRMVIVYTHWSEEYIAPTISVRNTAKLFADSGAKAVIGSHPHVILQSEKIGETLVYYSLGNFIFDQYWNKEVSTGLALELTIQGDKVEVLEHLFSITRDGRTCLLE